MASNGEMTAPCGVPSSAAVTTPSSMNPALSHLLIRRITRESNTMFEETNQPLVANRVKEPADIGVQNPASPLCERSRPPVHPARCVAHALAEIRTRTP